MPSYSQAVTLADIAKRLEPGGKVDKIVEMLSQSNEVLEDMLFVEGNLPTGHKSTIRTGLPSVAWRLLNYGVQPDKSTTVQVTDTCGMLESYAEIDKSLADLNGNTAAFRLSEDRAFLEAMNQEMAATLFYGDTGLSPERFLGLSARYSTSDQKNADNAANVLNGGGTGDCTSIWLVAWGENTVHGIYPKGSKAGFQHKDLGEVTLNDTDGGMYQGYRTHYKWDIGLTVRDWRYIARIANVNSKALASVPLLDLMIEASERLPSKNIGRPVFYMNRKVRTALRMQMLKKSNLYLGWGEAAGKPVLNFDDIPVRHCDAILNTEAAI